MATFHNIQLALRGVLSAGQVNAWALATFGKELTVLIGDRKKIQPEQFPVAVIIYNPTSLNESSSLFTVVDSFVIDLGVYDNDPETALAHLAEFERLVYKDLLADRSLSGIIDDLMLGTPLGDLGVNHPNHFKAVKIDTVRKESLT